MKSNLFQKWVGAGLLGGLLALSSAHAFPSASIKAAGIGGACVANPTDSLAQIYNPASVAANCQRWDAGFTVQYWERDFVQVNRLKAKRQWAAWPQGGVTTWINNNVAVGLAVATWDFLKTDGQTGIDGLGLPVPPRWDYWAETVRGSIGWRFNDCHALGVSLDYYYSRIFIRGIGNALVGGGPATHGPDYSSGLGVTVGYLCKILPNLSVGVSYSPKVKMRRYNRYSDTIATARIDLPPVYRVGISLQPIDCIPLTWSADGEFKQFDRVNSMSNAFNTNTPGSDAGPGYDWRNQWIAKTGVEWEICDWFIARAGYRYESGLFKSANRPGAYLNAALLRVVQHYATVGVTWKFLWDCELSAFGEYGIHQSANGTVPASITGPPAGQSIRFKENNIAFGFSFGQNF